MRRFAFVFVLFFCLYSAGFAGDDYILRWKSMPSKWVDAPFMGNGEMGTMVYRESSKSVIWSVGNSFAQDHRQEDDYSIRCPEVVNRGRVPIGFFRLKTRGLIVGADISLDLKKAEARGVIKTTLGSISFRTLVLSVEDVCVVEVEPSGLEKGLGFEFVPGHPESYRLLTVTDKSFIGKISPNPKPVVEADGEISLCRQNFAAGGMTATSWKQIADGSGIKLFFSTKHSYPDSSAAQLASDNVNLALQQGAALEIDHQNWWADYWAKSSVTLPDPFWNLFYKIQMYKLASASRADGALIDNSGPWLQPSSWNSTWWNLNVQLSYSSVYTANRLEIGDALVNFLTKYFDDLVANVAEEFRGDSAGLSRNTDMWSMKGRAGVPGGWSDSSSDIGYEVGNLTWICHNLYRHYRSSMDSDLRDNLLYPLLKRALNYYAHFLTEGDDGFYHLPETHSPEYGNAEDCNYDLSLIRWACMTLIELDKLRGESIGVSEEAGLVSKWHDILQRLVPYNVNKNGFMIGKNVGFDMSHRHWSHMLMVYPLNIFPPAGENLALIEKSLARWHSFPGALAGYSYTGGASFSALLGDGERALKYLNGFKPFMGKSTMYYEGGKNYWPVMETPLHCAQALQEMLLQFRRFDCEYDFPIDIFPAVPSSWKEIEFENLRAEGAFLVSAERRGGKTVRVKVFSEKDNQSFVRTDWAGKVEAEVSGEASVTYLDGGILLDMKAGSWVEFELKNP
ncbi:MAG: hypothetical protein JXR63_08015 [Spirochaetales bacterium]|nr:hypothetical protein [Spirochaetales bacterium]